MLSLASGAALAFPADRSDAPLPTGERYRWDTVTIGGGGYVTDVYCHPRRKDLVYIRTDVGGFYRWDSVNDAWIPLTEGFRCEQSNYYGGEGLALDPSDPNVVYIAAGKYSWSPLPGTLFKSTDQGRTWTKLPLEVKMGGNEDHRWGGQRLVVDPFHTGTLLFGSRSEGLWRTTDAGKHWQKVAGLTAELQEGTGVNALAFSPKTPGAVFASVWGDGVYSSMDGGQNWRRTESGPNEVERLSCAADGSLCASHAGGIGKYSGAKWADVTPAGVKGGFNAIANNPGDAGDVLAAVAGGRLQLFRSRDGGATWKPIRTESRSSVPWYSGGMRQIEATAGLTFDPVVPNRAWLTDWYATYRTEDLDADTVIFGNHEKGHEELVVFTMAAPPIDLPLLSGVADVDGFPHPDLASFPPHGIGDYYGGTGPTFGDCYQIAWCAQAPGNLVRVGGRRWNGTGGGAVSKDGGKTWSGFPAWDEKVTPARVAVSATDPANFVVLPLGDRPPLVTRDGGATWQRVTGLPTNFIPDPWNWSLPLAADGANAGVFYAMKDGSVYRSLDGGASFAVSASIPGIGPANLITVPGSAGEVYLSAGEGGILRSRDGGNTFRRLATVGRSLLFAVGKPAPGSMTPTLYLYGTLAPATEKHTADGIFRSTDGGKRWTAIQDPRRPIGDEPNSMTASGKTFGLVFIGTNGRGIYYGVPESGPRTTTRN